MTATPAKPRLPYLHYHPFPPEIHPEVDQAENEMIDWLTGHGLLVDPDRERAFRATRFAELVGREYPKADAAGLRMVANLYGWIFVVDDSVCDTGALGRNLAKLAAFHAWMREIMERGSVTAADGLARAVTAGLDTADRDMCHRLADAGNDLFRSIADRSSPTQYMRVVAGWDYYFLGTLWEAGHHARSTTPSPGEYAIGRRMTCGNSIGLALQDIAAGYEVPSDEYEHPAVRDLRRYNSNITSWCDDVFSYGKESEIESPRPLNLPNALMQHDGLDEQAALEETARLHNLEIEGYISTEAQVATWASPQLIRFLAAMCSMQRGYYDWGLKTPRYNVDHYFDTGPQTHTGHGTTSARGRGAS
ncbi:terpene synthase family protein [Streptomyces lushanensis]|uniref:terpene synthase family protein n=1 Tax=Streptomyces lushanensis TaxID=1434255 RepID=UPI0008303545|nr:hypothetical protein [Streptomyces lushanensis]